MPFRSKKQWRWAFANKKSFARRWARETPGAKGARYRALPTKKKEAQLNPLCNQALADAIVELALKERNYNAKAGQVIAGRLVRGGDGRFASGGSASTSSASSKRSAGSDNAKTATSSADAASAPKARRRRALKRRKNETPEQLAARQEEYNAERDLIDSERASERTATQKANEDKAFEASGLNEDAFYGLLDFVKGNVDAPEGERELEKAGLIERGTDGKYRTTAQGRALANAAKRGDTRGVKDAISEGTDRVKQRAERDTARAQRAAERTKRQAARDALRAASAARRAAQGGRRSGRSARRSEGDRSAQGRTEGQSTQVSDLTTRNRLLKALLNLRRARNTAQ